MTKKLLDKAPAGLKRKKKKSMIGIDPLAWMNEADTESDVTDEPTAEVVVAEEVTAEPEVTEELAAEPEVTEELAAEPEVTEELAAEPEVTEVEVESSQAYESPVETAGEIIENSQETPEEVTESASEEEEDMDMQQADFGLNGRFTLEGPITIADVAILHEKFKTSFSNEAEVEIDCSDIDGVDAAALQLLLACALELEKQNKKLIWKNPSDSMLSTVNLMGLNNEFNLQDIN